MLRKAYLYACQAWFWLSVGALVRVFVKIAAKIRATNEEHEIWKGAMDYVRENMAQSQRNEDSQSPEER